MYFPEQTDHYLLDETDLANLRIHSLETFGTHDGPGIRMVVFVQGCQFRCLYYQNPDSIDIYGGTLIPLDELVAKALQQKAYFGTKGGVTVSGGEPLLQRVKLIPFFEQLQENGIHTCLDSNGRVLDSPTKILLDKTDLLLLDVKHINEKWHKKLTTLNNKTTLEVAEYREKSGRPMWLRYVLVPGLTDQERYLEQWAKHFSTYQTIEKVEIIPFHQMGKHKWEQMGLRYNLAHTEPPSLEVCEKTQTIFSAYLTNVIVK